jgi:hypothetical protein
LTATSTTIDLTKSLAIAYAASLATTRDLKNLPIRRTGAAVPSGVAVEFVGSIGTGGTVTTGSVHTAATGTFAIGATTTTGGLLPATSLLAPALALSAVIAPSGIASVTAVDLTTSVPTAIDSSAPTTITGVAMDKAGTLLGGVSVIAVPDTALALAGASSPIATTASDGSYALQFATGGTYDVQFTDPAGRVAPVTVANATSASANVNGTLPAALHVTGTVTVHGQAGSLGNAAVEILCVACTGVALERPVGEAASTSTGAFSLAVPDPGVANARHARELDNVRPWPLFAAPSRPSR